MGEKQKMTGLERRPSVVLTRHLLVLVIWPTKAFAHTTRNCCTSRKAISSGAATTWHVKGLVELRHPFQLLQCCEAEASFDLQGDLT